MRKQILTILVGLMTTAAFAAVGPQSIRVTFNGDNAEGWVASSGGSITSVADGVANVQMKAQSGETVKYRADFQYNTNETFSFDKVSDAVWAIKLTSTLPGTANSRKFELQYNDGSNNHWINDIGGPSGTLDCAGGGKIYYFDLTTISAKIDKVGDNPGTPFNYADFTSKTLTVQQIHFIFADAEGLTDETARYSVDWVATFASVDDLKSFTDWTDEAQEADASLPYMELCFRPKADGSGYDSRCNGFKDVQQEGNYQARLFAVEYFLIDNFSESKTYTFTFKTTGGGGTSAMAVWDFPYEVSYENSASDMISKAADVIGIAPSATTGETKAPLAESNCVSSVWTFSEIPGFRLTPLAKHGTKTLVGLFVTSKELKSSSSCKFATAAHTSVTKPAYAVGATTYQAKIGNTPYATFADALSAATDGQTIELLSDASITSQIRKNSMAVTIDGRGYTLTNNFTTSHPILTASGNTIIIKDVVIDGNSTATTYNLVEAGGGSTILQNVTIKNFNSSNNLGIVCAKSNGVLNMTNVVFENCTNTGSNSAIVFLGNNNCTISGSLTFTSCTGAQVFLENSYFITVDDATSVINLTFDSDRGNNSKTVAGSTETNKFTVTSANWLFYVTSSQINAQTVTSYYDLVVNPVAGMATMVIGFDAPIPAGVKAYTLHNSGSSDIFAYEVESIEANKPVLVVAEGGTYRFGANATTSEESNPRYEALVGTYASATVPACSDGVYNYILTNGEEGVGFYQVADASNKIGAHRAYISCGYDTQASVAPGAPARRMVINFNAPQTPTAVEDVVATDKAEKLLLNGQIYIRKSGHMYRIDGQLVK